MSNKLSDQDYDNLKYAIEHDMLDMSRITTDVEELKRAEALEKHPYSIWQGKNGLWYTHVANETSPDGRKLIKRKTKEDLEKALVKAYKDTIDIPSFGECFRMYQEHTLESGKVVKNTYDRKDNDYDRFIAGTDIDSMRIDRIQDNDLIIFLDGIISKHRGKIARKAFNNLKGIISGVFAYAKVYKRYNCIYAKELLSMYSPSGRQFTPKKVKEQVFNDEEVEMIINHIKQHSWDNMRHLGLLFMLFTGLRLGEACTLKLSDFKSNGKLHVQRSLTKEKDENGKSHRIVSDSTKTESSNAEILLSDDAIAIYDRIIELRELNNETSEWFLAENGDYISDNKMDKALRKLCNELGITERGCHKLRKTYCSEMLEAGVSEKLVQEQMRHADITTTRNHYYFSTKVESDKREQINMNSRLRLAN